MPYSIDWDVYNKRLKSKMAKITKIRRGRNNAASTRA
jgi:hypothetical protein